MPEEKGWTKSQCCSQIVENVYYHPRMRVGNVFSHVCLSVCLSVQAITFELYYIDISFWYASTYLPYLGQV